MATKVFLPRLGESIEEAVIGRWCKKVGDVVGRGEVIVELETSKAAMDLESPRKGILLATFPKEGETVQKGSLIAIVGEEGEHWQTLLEEEDEVESESEDKPTSGKQDIEREVPKTSQVDRMKISPNAKRILKDQDIDLKMLAERFPHKRITSADAELYLREKKAYKEEGASIQSAELSGVQSQTAKLMMKSQKEIPAFSLTKAIQADKLLAAHDKAKKEDENITLTALIIQKTAVALRNNPEINAFYKGGKIHVYEEVNISVAINTGVGVISPVIKNADQLPIQDIATQLKDLALKTSKNTLKIDDLSGGTFTISNLGMMGIDQFVPMITPGQGAVLGIGKVSEELSLGTDGKISKKSMISVTINADHRILSGAQAAKFLNDLETEMQKDDG